jgi:uncharacterized membrane protein
MRSHSHLIGYTILGLIVVLVILGVIAMCSPRYRRRVLLAAGWTAGGLAGAYAVLRGIAEFFVIHYNDPASYRGDWGGPSLAGVFLVHSGPGFAVLVAAAVYAWRKVKARRTGASLQPAPLLLADSNRAR